jgi:hypothetical protein
MRFGFDDWKDDLGGNALATLDRKKAPQSQGFLDAGKETNARFA